MTKIIMHSFLFVVWQIKDEQARLASQYTTYIKNFKRKRYSYILRQIVQWKPWIHPIKLKLLYHLVLDKRWKHDFLKFICNRFWVTRKVEKINFLKYFHILKNIRSTKKRFIQKSYSSAWTFEIHFLIWRKIKNRIFYHRKKIR